MRLDRTGGFLVPSHMGRPNLQTTIETHHDVDGIFDQVRRGNYVNLPAFLNDPHQIYLDCYMKGYIVPHMNSWMELLIRRRNAKAN
nr:hypothetical protein [Tanacetum cinerariifolium]